MISLLTLLPFVTMAHASDEEYGTLLTQAKGSLLAGEFRDARDLLTAAEEAAPLTDRPLLRKDVARLYFYRGVLYWRASPESAALDAWRQTLTIDPNFEPESDLLTEPAERDTFHALVDEVRARGDIVVDLPEDPGEAMIYIDGQVLEPSDTVIAGTHLIQIKCEGGDVMGAWHSYGAPPPNYLSICDGGVYKAGSRSSSSSKSSKSSSTKASTSKASKSSSSDGGEKKKGGAGKTIAGVSLMGVGVGGGVVSALLYSQANTASQAYDKKVTAARDNPDIRKSADAYYDDVVVPRFTQFYAAAGASGVLLAGGLVLVILDVDGPMIAPIPGGGGMISWTGRF